MTMVKSTSTIYIVRSGLAGLYMPDDIAYFATKADARAYMLDEKYSALDNGDKVSGSVQAGYYGVMPAGASEYHSGFSIVLDSISALFLLPAGESFSNKESFVQYLNDHS